MENSFLPVLTQFDFSQSAALCSVQFSAGSIPRKDHPMMLVLSDGSIEGTVGGGAMEQQVIGKAREIMDTETPELLSFQMTGKDINESVSICGGSLQVLIEPYTPAMQKLWSVCESHLGQHRNRVLATEIRMNDGIRITRRIYDGDDDSLDLQLQKNIQEVFQHQRALTVTGDNQHLLLDPIYAASELHIFGCGHVGKAVADLAHFLQMDVHVYDDRAELAVRERFPFAASILTAPLDQLASEVHLASLDAVLVSTRDHRIDLNMMRWLLTKDISYLGLMSSPRKWQMIANELRTEGMSDDRIRAVKAPVGLEIGSETVPEIAMSIMAEIVHWLKRPGGPPLPLSDKRIHIG